MQAWKIVQNRPYSSKMLIEETQMTQGNGYMTCRGGYMRTPESGTSYPGVFVAGVFDVTDGKRAGPCIVNFPDFFKFDITICGEELNLSKGKIQNYSRVLDMKDGILNLKFVWTSQKGKKTEVQALRFISMSQVHGAVQAVQLRPLNYSGQIIVDAAIDASFGNTGGWVEYENNKKFLYKVMKNQPAGVAGGLLLLETTHTKEQVCELFDTRYYVNGAEVPDISTFEKRNHGYRGGIGRCSRVFKIKAKQNTEYKIDKYISVTASRDDNGNITRNAMKICSRMRSEGFEQSIANTREAWSQKWQICDIDVDGPVSDQQAIRFSIYHLLQSGPLDPRNNLGSRGLTSECHNGGSFWDTEIFMLPFYIYTQPEIARNLVKYRYLTLEGARDKAKKLWCEGASYAWISIYPGYEAEPFWEYAAAHHITGDVAYGLLHYFRATNDTDFMLNYGVEILIETSRFWASRVTLDKENGKYSINSVRGPNEYDGLVNNNLYTNMLAKYSLLQAVHWVELLNEHYPKYLDKLKKKLHFYTKEIKQWRLVAANIVLPYDHNKEIWLEDESFLKKQEVDAKKFGIGAFCSIEKVIRWEAIFRFQIIKQADVLALMFLFPGQFSYDKIKKAYEFYEPRCTHHSSLSYCTHSIIANWIGKSKPAYDYFRTNARLDLDDLMNKSFFGIHAANCGGTWKSVVYGFAGMSICNGKLEFNPKLPKQWKSINLKIIYQGVLHDVKISGKNVEIKKFHSGVKCLHKDS